MDNLSPAKVLEMERMANHIRKDVIDMLVSAGSGHSAGPLGMADVMTALYFHILRHHPQDPKFKDRDRFVLSNGHTCPVLYATLARAGYFPVEELVTLRRLGSRLQGHPHRESLPGLETTSGPLGSGLAQGVGMALAARIDGHAWRTYVVVSDGEHDEGNHWEAVAVAAKHRLSNLTLIIDRNNIQIDGYTEDVMPLESLRDKYTAWNWHVLEINGHSMEAIVSACAEAKAIYERPTAIIAHTIPGKGVSYMEFDYKWHGVPPGIQNMPGEPKKEDQVRIALHDLRTLGGKITSEHE